MLTRPRAGWHTSASIPRRNASSRCAGFVNPSVMGAAVRAPTVAASPVVMGFFDKKEEAPKKVVKT